MRRAERTPWDVPRAVSELFETARQAGYVVERTAQRMLIWHQRGPTLNKRDDKLGGWNHQLGHWYISQMAADSRHPVPGTCGFCWHGDATPPHWRLEDCRETPEHAPAFRAAIEELAEVRFS